MRRRQRNGGEGERSREVARAKACLSTHWAARGCCSNLALHIDLSRCLFAYPLNWGPTIIIINMTTAARALPSVSEPCSKAYTPKKTHSFVLKSLQEVHGWERAQAVRTCPPSLPVPKQLCSSAGISCPCPGSRTVHYLRVLLARGAHTKLKSWKLSFENLLGLSVFHWGVKVKQEPTVSNGKVRAFISVQLFSSKSSSFKFRHFHSSSATSVAGQLSQHLYPTKYM